LVEEVVSVGDARVRVAAVAPKMGENVSGVEAGAMYHCRVGVGIPDTVHVNETGCPTVTLCAVGARVNVGLAELTVSRADALATLAWTTLLANAA
jgi:hypothetical protein